MNDLATASRPASPNESDVPLFSQVYSALVRDLAGALSALGVPNPLNDLDPLAAFRWFEEQSSDLSFGKPALRVAIEQMGVSLAKKYTGDSFLSRLYTDKDREKAALDTLFRVNENMRIVNERFAILEARPLSAPVFRPLTKYVLNEARDLIHKSLESCNMDSPSLAQVFMYARPGPNSSVGTKSTTFYHKVAACPHTYSSEKVRSLYGELVKVHPLWRDTELNRSLLFHKADSQARSKLALVPKSYKTFRTIMVEPIEDSILQLGIGGLVEQCLKRRYGIDLSRQQAVNRRMARKSSLYNRWATVDLSSASDSLSIGLVKYLLPKPMFELMFACRAAQAEMPDKTVLELNMFSTMGNGFTFPLQTLVFASLVAVISDLKGRRRRLVVNGDDIICPRDVVEELLGVLQDIGFEINESKTFIDSAFRESCGSDYYLGYPVRGVYCESFTGRADTASLLNRLVRWSSIHGILLGETIKILLDRLAAEKADNLVPPSSDDCAGIHVPLYCRLAFGPYYKSTDSRRVLVRGARGPAYCGHTFVAYEPRTHYIGWRVHKRHWSVSKTCKNFLNWPSGVMLGVLHGSLSNRGIAVKSSVLAYDISVKEVSGWDIPRAGTDFGRGVSYEFWSIIVSSLLGPMAY